MVQISRKDLERLAIGFGIADFLTEGRLSAPIARGTKAALKKAAPAIARGLIQYGPTVAVTAARVTPTPLAAAATGAFLVQNREQVAELARRGIDVTAPIAQQGFNTAVDYGQGVIERALDPATFRPLPEPTVGFPFDVVKRPTKKRLSKFNRAVKAGMTAVRNSKSYGKKGTISNAKRAFSAVTKVASKVNKGKKVSAKGVTGTIARAVRKIL